MIERIAVIVLGIVMMPPMFVGAVALIGMTLDSVVATKIELERCQKRADTPYQYHRCR